MSDPGRDSSARGPSPVAMLGLGIEMTVPILVFLFVGFKLDEWLKTSPWLMVTGSLLGIVIGFYNLYKRVVPTKSNGDGSGK